MPAGRPRRSTSRGRGRGRGGRTSGAAAEMTPSTSTTSPTENATEEIPNKRMYVFKKMNQIDFMFSKLEDDPVTVPFNDSPFNDENNGCPICFDDYAQTGEHRLVTLKCGHLFGKSCIERWIKTEKIEQCPTCKKKAKAADIIAIFIPSGVLVSFTISIYLRVLLFRVTIAQRRLNYKLKSKHWNKTKNA